MSIEAKEVLRSEVHGPRHGEAGMPQSEPQSLQGGGDSQAILRDVQVVAPEFEAPRPPQGRESAQQYAVELDDVVRLLSPSLSLAEFHEDRRTSEALRALRETINEAGAVLHSPSSIQEVWASLGEEAKDRIRMGFDASRWRKMVSFPLSKGEPNRMMRLKGYGNAINVEAARVFIESYLEQ